MVFWRRRLKKRAGKDAHAHLLVASGRVCLLVTRASEGIRWEKSWVRVLSQSDHTRRYICWQQQSFQNIAAISFYLPNAGFLLLLQAASNMSNYKEYVWSRDSWKKRVYCEEFKYTEEINISDCFMDHAFHRDSVGRKAPLSFSARLPSKSPQKASSAGFDHRRFYKGLESGHSTLVHSHYSPFEVFISFSFLPNCCWWSDDEDDEKCLLKSILSSSWARWGLAWWLRTLDKIWNNRTACLS